MIAALASKIALFSILGADLVLQRLPADTCAAELPSSNAEAPADTPAGSASGPKKDPGPKAKDEQISAEAPPEGSPWWQRWWQQWTEFLGPFLRADLSSAKEWGVAEHSGLLPLVWN